jgi:hypothetical protein
LARKNTSMHPPQPHRAGVRPDVIDRVLGYKIGGVAEIYQRHNYTSEKREALEALSRLLYEIVD